MRILLFLAMTTFPCILMACGTSHLQGELDAGNAVSFLAEKLALQENFFGLQSAEESARFDCYMIARSSHADQLAEAFPGWTPRVKPESPYVSRNGALVEAGSGAKVRVFGIRTITCDGRNAVIVVWRAAGAMDGCEIEYTLHFQEGHWRIVTTRLLSVS